MDRRQMIKRIKAITGGFRTVAPATVAVETEATRVAKALKGTPGLNTAIELALVKAFEAISGLDIKSEYDRAIVTNPSTTVRFLKPLACVIGLAPYGAIQATDLGKPIVIVGLGGGNILHPTNGQVLGSINGMYHNQVRLATDAEIDALPDAVVNALIQMYS